MQYTKMSMFLFILVAILVLRMLYSVAFFRARADTPVEYPPRVPSIFPWLGSALAYVLKPSAFLAMCQERYGPVFKLKLGGRDVVIVSTGNAITSVLTANHRILCNEEMHYQMFHVVAGVRTNYTTLHSIMVHRLFPLLDKCFSERYLGKVTQPFGRALYSRIEEFTQSNEARTVSLTQSVQEPLYFATNVAIFGTKFPANSYADFHMLDASVPARFSRLLLWSWPSDRARERLLMQIVDYLHHKVVVDCDAQFASGFINVFEEHSVPPRDAAHLVLTFMWGLHSNTLSTAFWLLAFLLANPDALARVRSEIDHAIEDKFLDLEVLLNASPRDLDDPCFTLLTSAIMETMRLTALHAAVRRAECDFDLKDGDTTIPIRRGEFILGNVHAVHMDERNYPEPHKFLVDRFAGGPHQKGRLPTGNSPFFSLGMGKHLCKGRHLAMYEIKVLTILYLRLFDLVPVSTSPSGWRLPQVNQRSIGVIHTTDEVMVQFRARELSDG